MNRPIGPIVRWHMRHAGSAAFRDWIDCALVVAFIVVMTWIVGWVTA